MTWIQQNCMHLAGKQCDLSLAISNLDGCVVFRHMEGQAELLRSGCATCWAVWDGAAMLKLSEMRFSISCTAIILGRNAVLGWR